MNQSLLQEFDQEMQGVRRTLERVPDGKRDWKPHPKSMTLGRLAGHVAELPGWGANALKLDELNLEPTAKGTEVSGATEALAMFDRSVAETREALATASDEYLMKTWTLKLRGNVILSMPRIVVWRSFVMNHIVHHRAQLGVYLRLHDIAVPAIYGPSADEGKFG